MKSNKIWLLLAFVLTLSALFLVSPVQASIDGGYVGTGQATAGAGTTCLSCHDSDGPAVTDRTSFLETGHPWKYKHTGGAAPTDPLSGLFPTVKGNDIDTLTMGDNCGEGLIVCDVNGNLDWSAINYTVGGFGWKIRWGVKDPTDAKTGYVWTSSAGTPTQAQYNIENGSWSAYNGNKDKKYECAVCHNTNGIVSTAGYACVTDGGTNLAPARTEPWASNTGMGPEAATRGGYYSSWTFNGVQCEACHGAGEAHTLGGPMGILETAPGVEICAKCHIRSENDNGQSAECGGDTAGSNVLTLGAKSAADYIGHHEQYNELVGLNGDGAHATLDCTTCHDPHKRAAGVIGAVETALGIAAGTGSQPAAGAIVATCESCHPTKDVDGSINIAGHAAVTCVDCHMGEATKSATASTGAQGWGRKGDVKTHIFAIDPAGTSTINRSNGVEDNAAVGGNDNGVCEAGETCFKVAVNALPVNYSCGKCHDLGTATDLTMAQAQTVAAGYHVSIDNGYIGTNVCLTCHTDKEEDFMTSGHPWKYKHTGGTTPPNAWDPLSSLFPTVKGNDIDTLTMGDNCGEGLIVCDVNGNLDWSAINYTIGGFGWKIRWGVKDATDAKTGFVWTSSAGTPTQAQYNLEDGSWSAYNGGKDKKYECAACHNTNGIVSTTGYACETDGGTNLAPARTEPWASNPGMGPEAATRGGYLSSWTFDGVQCEACHGPGDGHVYSVTPVLETAPGVEICAKCHIRSENDNGQSAECGGDTAGSNVLTLGAKSDATYIGHHEQYNELVGLNGDGAHAALACTACHNPHKRAHKVVDDVAIALGIADNDDSAEARGAIIVSCNSCHGTGTPLAAAGGADTKVAATNHVSGTGAPDCVDCHMGAATKSATAQSGTWGRKGDVKTHIFAIDPAGTSAINRSNGKEVNSATGGNDDGICDAGETCFMVAKNALPVNYSCGKCHDSGLSSSYVGYPLDLGMAQQFAVGMHGAAVPSYGISFTLSATGLTVNVDATVDCGGVACPADLAYDWDWDNDGAANNGTGDPATHDYTSGGSKTIKLTVSSVIAGGNVGSYSRSVTLANPNGAPVAGATCVFDANTWEQTVTDVSTDDGPDADAANDTPPTLKIVIDWGDGLAKKKLTATQNWTHTYTKVGTFSASLKAIDDKLQTDTTFCADVTTAYFTIGGTVTKSDGTTPLSSASVQLLNSQNRAIAPAKLTSAAGAFSFGNLRPGTYTVKVTKSGYTFTTTNVTVGPDSLANVISAN